ncbi:MAG: FAD-dependent thymidylate synthase [candidate division BRC1 bacterium ADurb.BinA364]|nr:MAG: FAD-dependent thymidylate synthase [candidate division BRC1 bacterium ADurb.BinA364]
MEKSHASAIGKKSQEIARYALPIGWHTALYHTVSGLTLLRYWRACRLGDSPAEQEIVARQMIEALLRHDPGFESLPTEPLPPAPAPLSESANSAAARREFVAEFDASMEGHVSKLIDWSERAEALLAESVREILCASPASLSDDQAIALALDPACNPLLGDSLNLATLDKATRALAHPRYIFRKKLSHSADSQDQRHRMTPGSRPYLAPSLRGGPDYIVPALILEDSAIERLYRQAVESAWEAIERLLDRGTSPEHALYLLPNAVAIRFTESADLMSLRHKHAMRLCYNAQEEIWRASLDEARQIQAIHPRIGAWLLPPCGQRLAAGAKPICPEGSRFCGVRVWTMKLEDYKRLI